MRPVSVCATSASGPSTSNLGLGFGVASAAAAACCARPLPALAAAACSRPLHRHPSLTSGAPGTGLSGAASARQHHRSAATLVASALKRPGAAAGTDGGTDGSSGGGGGLVRSRSSRTTLTRSAPAADVVAAAAPQAEPHGQPQRRLRRRTETQAVEPGAPAGGPAATATATTATTTAAHFTSSSTDYTAWKVSELQEALAAHGLPRTGRKAELVERLAAAVASGAAAGAGSRSALASSAPAAAGPSVAAAAAAAAEVAAPLPRQRSRLTVARSTATADFENGRGAAAAAPSGTAGRAGRAAAAATAATANAAVKQGSSDAESGAASGGFLDALFDTLTLDITVREQRPGRRPRPATTDGAAARSPSASRAGSTAADSPPAQSSRTAAAAGRGTDSLGSVRLDLGGEGDDEPAAQPAAAAAEAASEAAGEARPRRLTIRRERTSDAGDTRPMASAAAVAPTPAPALPTPVAAEGPPERPRREPRPPVGPAPDLSQLPPWPPQFLGRLRRLEEVAPGEIEKQEEAVLQNVQGLALTCLGSAPCLATRAAAAVAGAAGEDRALGSLALARGKDIFIFDVGDDTQRQVGQAYHVKPSKIFRIFLTSLAPEAVLGLPGLMCTINASRERGHEFADIPVHVYGPPGTAAFLVAMMRVSQTYLEITVVVHEFAVGHVSAAELAPIVGGGGGGSGPIAVDKNRRISRLALPPDQLNPRGGVDASLLTFAPEQGRAQRRKGRNASGGVLSFDARAGYLPWPELQPGDPDSRRELPDPLSLTWTLELDVSGRVVACLLPAAPGQPGAFGGGGDGQSYVLAYTVVEADRSGALVMERAAAAGLEGGPDFARLKQGETIANAWGQPIPPELIISPKRAGRRVVVTGSAADLTPLTAHAHTRGADILVPGAVWLQAEADAAAEHGGCTTAAVGAAAAALGVRYVVLSRFSGPSATAAAGAAAAAAAAAAAGATAEQGLQDEEEDELPMDAHTNRLVAEVEAAALAAAGGSAAAGSSGNEAAASTGASRRRSVRKTAVVAGAGAGGSGYAGAAVAGHRLRRVLVLRDLETTMMEKNEGPMEPQEE